MQLTSRRYRYAGDFNELSALKQDWRSWRRSRRISRKRRKGNERGKRMSSVIAVERRRRSGGVGDGG
eukprot:525212-Hanusia_phi.AAC.11